MKHLQFFVFLFFMSFAVNAQTVYEDFEGGTPDLVWAPINGLTYGGSVANPSKDAVNGSDYVGEFTNDGISDFCFGLADLTSNADLSTYNLIKIKIWAPRAPLKALLKFEGGGKAIEKFIDITVANQWVEYAVDFSGAATYTTLNKILLSFDPFTTPQTGTFYFDDIVGVEAKQV